MIADAPDDASRERREVFALFGLASYHAQCLERQIGIMLSTCYNHAFSTASPDARDLIFDEHFSKTLGALIRKLESTITVPPNLAESLQAALKKRNWLIHHYFYDRASDILSSPGRHAMMKELTELYMEFNRLDTHLDSVMDRWCEKAGLSKHIEEAMSQLSNEKLG